ncbi:MAG: UvrD-helicase domain-containing protein [Thermodesulfobacteriota bacterium]|nr:UvrD-helicase domain-containing protein [Thermodesulfobacteriota bacterium]
MSLLNDLNPVQQKAVLETEGPLLVFAGAGSGKTRVLTYRIAYLIQERGVLPRNIFAVTFTNKAADEMRERAEHLLGKSARGIWISTFHSACARILRQHIDHLGFRPNFVIYDDDDQERHLKSVMKELDLDFKMFHPRAMQSAINRLKNEGVTPEQYRPSPFNIFEKRLSLVYQQYQEDLQRNNGVDFGDLLLFVTLLFKNFPEVLRSYQELCRYVMVDEFQDTNLIQYQLIKRLAERHQNICVVGDDDQSIYRWRGAEVGNILNFEKDFSGTKVITLEQNYRSTQNILQAANHIVRRNRLRKEKVLWTENPEGELLASYVAEDEADEARFVVKKIAGQVPSSFSGNPEGSNRPYRDIAVFYRINAQSRAIEEELVKHQIPYTIVGGVKFYERKEIKDILAYLKLIANPSDGLSLKRIINNPSRGIGEKTMEKMGIFAREKGLPLYEGMKQAMKEDWLPPTHKERMEAFVLLIEEFRQEIKVLSLSQLTLALLGRTGYLERLKVEGTDEALSRVDNIDELINVMAELEKGEEEVSLETFLDRVSLVSDVDLYEDRENRVSLMTLHCAKGLEFPVVFIVGMEEGLLPHYRRGEGIEDLEEERRLCYVGITRAKEKLYLSRAEKRSTFGVGRANLASRFLDELPFELIRCEERERRMESLFSQETSWFDDFNRSGDGVDFSAGENIVSGKEGVVWSPEGFFPLRTGMRVRHSKFGEGRVKAVEGMDENQKATIVFRTEGPKRLKVRYANLEILE